MAIIKGTEYIDYFIYGTDDDDTIETGDGGDFRIHAGLGKDYIDTGAGDDTYVFGGADNDTINTGVGDDSHVYGDDGDDIIDTGDGYDANIYGGSGDDIINTGSGRSVRVFGGEGNDRITTGDGNDVYIYGDNGVDIINTGDGDDIYVYGGSNNDTINTGAGNDENIYGGDGDDTLDGGVIDYARDDAFIVGYKNNKDTLFGESGSDKFVVKGFYVGGSYDGGEGNDTLDLGQSDSYTTERRFAEHAGVKVNLSEQIAYTYRIAANNWTWTDAEGRITLKDIENLIGSSESDILIGDANANILDGGVISYQHLDTGVLSTYNTNNDYLNGGGGHDTFRVRGFYVGGRYDGGEGSDTIDFTQADDYTALRRAEEEAGVYVNLNEYVAFTYCQPTVGTWTAAEGMITLFDIENIYGSQQSDILVGDSKNNVIAGGTGNDSLTGGAGDDVLVGGDGADTFKFTALDNSANGGLGLDQLLDFTSRLDPVFQGDEDILDLSSLFAPGVVNASNITQYVNISNGTLQVDRDGSASGYSFKDLIQGFDVSINNTHLDELYQAGQILA